MSLDHALQHKVLSNGISVVSIPLANTEAVTLMVFMGVGSRYEKDSQQGLAHFTEHMVFKGGAKYKSTREISEALDAVGGEFNAFTSHEYTAFYTKTGAPYLTLGLDVISDMLLNATFPPAELEKEKGVIVEEINMYEDMPMRKVDQLLGNLLFGDTGMGRPIIGTKESVTAFSDADFHNWIKEKFVGSQCTIVVAGAVDSDQVATQIESYFGSMQKGEAYKPAPAVVKEGISRVMIEDKKSEQTHLMLSVEAFPNSDPRRMALRVLTTVLGGNMSSRLFTHVREEQGLCYYVRAMTDTYIDCGFLIASAGVDNTRLPQAVGAIMEQLRLMRYEGISEEELSRAKQYLTGKTLLAMEDSESVAEYYAAQDRLEGKRETPAKVLKLLEEVTLADVRKVAEDLFHDSKLRLAAIGPQAGKEAELEKLLTFTR
jgi:predicted Zn-dependent peptidase